MGFASGGGGQYQVVLVCEEGVVLVGSGNGDGGV